MASGRAVPRRALRRGGRAPDARRRPSTWARPAAASGRRPMAALSWQNISDGFFKRASVGALAVAQSDPNVIYVGMGESTIRGNVSHGDGVYKSVDGGETWTHCGLAATRNIGKVRDPPDEPRPRLRRGARPRARAEPERGVYRSNDGGADLGTGPASATRSGRRSTCRSTRTTRASSTPRSGRRGAARTTWSAAAPGAASSNRPMAATPGPS